MNKHAFAPNTLALSTMIIHTPLRIGVFTIVLMLGSASVDLSVAQVEAPGDASSLVRASFERYNPTWYRSLTFVQQTIRYRPNGSVDTAVWYEAYHAPGRLRIDVAPLTDGTMFLFAQDTQYVFQNDTLVSARRMVHPLLLLGFDLYFLSPDQTLGKLEELGFDLNVVRNDFWLGRPAVVVGAVKGDTTRAQFWIDAERLVFVRMLMPVSGRIQEVQFNNYQRLEGGWLAPEVVIAVDGRIVMKEVYNDIRTATPLDATFFDPSAWRTARHWHPSLRP